MRRRELLLMLLLFCLGLFTRLPIVEKMHTHTDSSSLTLALVNYNLVQETPAPPGYPLYFAIGKFFQYFIGDPHKSLILVSVLFSGIGALVFYFVGKKLISRIAGIISSLIFLSAPTIYFFGLTVYPYILVFSSFSLVVWCIYEILFKKKNFGLHLGIIYAVSIGIRPQELITTLPLFLLGLYYLNGKERIRSIASFVVISLFWFIPFLKLVGGLKNYISVSSRAASLAIPAPSLFQFIFKKFELLSSLYLTLGLGILVLVLFFAKELLLYCRRKRIPKFNLKKVLFFSFWIGPSLIFNLFIRTEHAGYQIAYLSFLIYGVSYILYKSFSRKRKILILFVFILVVFNLFNFFYNRDPNYMHIYRQTSFHYSDIRRNDYSLSVKISYIKKNFLPDQTIIIAGPYFWRSAKYYLPEFKVYNFDSLFTKKISETYVVREAFDLKNKEYFQKISEGLIINKSVKYMILFDDDSNFWIRDNFKIISFKGITKLMVIPVEKNDKIIFNYMNIEIIK